jgi:hypothetical protein
MSDNVRKFGNTHEEQTALAEILVLANKANAANQPGDAGMLAAVNGAFTALQAIAAIAEPFVVGPVEPGLADPLGGGG